MSSEFQVYLLNKRSVVHTKRPDVCHAAVVTYLSKDIIYNSKYSEWLN